jgi:hypothetical protein
MRDLREALAGEKCQSIGNYEILKRLDKIHPGFIAWALQIGDKKPAPRANR